MIDTAEQTFEQGTEQTSAQTTAQTADRIRRITRIVSDHLEIEPEEIAPTDRFVEDHGADSLALIGVLAALEAEFKVGIDQSELPRMTDISSVDRVISDISSR